VVQSTPGHLIRTERKPGGLRRKLPRLSQRYYIEGKYMANEEYFDFEEVLERINNLEVVVAELLKGPELNYKRPGATEYEKLADTLNYLHNKVSELESK
jgi:coenzyme F420-reducing hydrogenase delta subunit